MSAARRFFDTTTSRLAPTRFEALSDAVPGRLSLDRAARSVDNRGNQGWEAVLEMHPAHRRWAGD